jgi:hypothetical protein
MTTSAPLIPVSWGEVIDKATILEIKRERIRDGLAVANVRRELDAINKVVAADLVMTDELRELRGALAEVNAVLWDVEDSIRECEHRNDFGDQFIQLARSVYRHNDERARLKRLINLRTSSGLIEEKSYR